MILYDSKNNVEIRRSPIDENGVGSLICNVSCREYDGRNADETARYKTLPKSQWEFHWGAVRLSYADLEEVMRLLEGIT